MILVTIQFISLVSVSYLQESDGLLACRACETDKAGDSFLGRLGGHVVWFCAETGNEDINVQAYQY